MPATWANSGSFNAAVWEARMARPAAPPERRVMPPSPTSPGERAPLAAPPLTGNPYSAPLRRASRIVRARLKAMEAPPGPLSPQRKKLLSLQTSRLSEIVEKLVIASGRYDEEHRDPYPYSQPRSAA